MRSYSLPLAFALCAWSFSYAQDPEEEPIEDIVKRIYLRGEVL